MNVWKLLSANHLVKSEEPAPEVKEGQLKIRITKVLVNRVDAMIFNGSFKVTYPVIPGRFAVGRIAESGAEGYEKGQRVLLRTFIDEEDTGTAKKDFTIDDYEVCGQTTDGFFQDFVITRPDNVVCLPESVHDNEALLIELVALAKAALDALEVSKGDHIAVIGGDILGIILGKLLIYQQISPILIDNHTNRLQFAKECGIYYTSFADDNMVESVAEITGGRLADGAIFVTSSGTNDKSLPFKVLAKNTKAAYAGFHGYEFSVDLDVALRKQISIFGVTNGEEYLSTAINLLANKAIDLSSFRFIAFEASETEKTYEALSVKESENDPRTIYVAELV